MVLTDLHMPNGLSGFELCDHINDNYTIPVVAVSASAHEQDREAAVEHGFIDLMLKPINGSKVKNLLSQFGVSQEKLLGHATSEDGVEYLDPAALMTSLKTELPTVLELFERALRDKNLSGIQQACHQLLELDAVEILQSIVPTVKQIQSAIRNEQSFSSEVISLTSFLNQFTHIDSAA